MLKQTCAQRKDASAIIEEGSCLCASSFMFDEYGFYILNLSLLMKVFLNQKAVL